MDNRGYFIIHGSYLFSSIHEIQRTRPEFRDKKLNLSLFSEALKRKWSIYVGPIVRIIYYFKQNDKCIKTMLEIPEIDDPGQKDHWQIKECGESIEAIPDEELQKISPQYRDHFARSEKGLDIKLACDVLLLVSSGRAANIVFLVNDRDYPEKMANRRNFSLSPTRQIKSFSTNLYKSRELELIDFLDGLKKEFLVDVSWGHFDLIFASRVNQMSWQIEQISAQSMQGSRVPPLRQTQPFEPVDQIVSQQNQMKMNLIGQKTVGGNIAQREAFLEFLDVQFASGSGFVKMPYALWVQWEIGNKGMVKVILEFPERELIVFFLAFGPGPAHYDEAMRPLPVVRLVSKQGYLPPVFPEGMITKILHLFLNRLGHFGYDYITNPFLVEWLDELVVEESRVGANSDSVEVSGNLLSTSRPKRLGSACWMGVSRTQETTPGISGMAFEADQRMITGASGLGRVVSNLGSFDFPAKDWQDSRIQIEDETAGRMRQVPNFPAQQIVNPDNPFQFQRIEVFEEFSQGGRIGEILQSQQSLKTTVVMKNSRIGNTSHTSHHRINKCIPKY